MSKIAEREIKRSFRHMRIRKRVVGTPERPRLCVHRSHKQFYAQLIDDSAQKVLFGMSTLAKVLKGKNKFSGNKDAAMALGEVFAKEATKKGFSKVSFDRGGYLYHGRVKAFADAARSGGLEF